jgi:hypothetical protein
MQTSFGTLLNRPDVKAGLIFGLISGVFQAINLTTGGMAFVMGWPIFIAESLLLGMVVVQFASHDSLFSPKDYIRLAFYSSFWSIIAQFLIGVIVAVVLMGLTLGTAVVALITGLASSLFAILLQVIFPPIGAWMYIKFGGKRLIAGTIGLGCGCSLLLIILGAGIFATILNLIQRGG